MERLRLLCFPNAGGGASAYRLWQERLPSDVEVCPVQLPGRETRLREPALRELPALIELLRVETAQLRQAPFAFFGHSLGALVAFELTRALRRRGERLPAQLFVSACRAPHTEDDGVALSSLDDTAFLDALREFAGTPEPVLQDRELLALVLPTLRADFALRDGYRHTEEPGLPVPITAYGGEDDEHVPQSSLFGWRAHTQHSFSFARFPGGHFYLRDQPAFFLTLGHALSRLTRRSRGVLPRELKEHNGTHH
jgi:medium-chain acyl-[acyl-carrier-protein] hydrolase